jgi:hypothetical protein
VIVGAPLITYSNGTTHRGGKCARHWSTKMAARFNLFDLLDPTSQAGSNARSTKGKPGRSVMKLRKGGDKAEMNMNKHYRFIRPTIFALHARSI